MCKRTLSAATITTPDPFVLSTQCLHSKPISLSFPHSITFYSQGLRYKAQLLLRHGTCLYTTYKIRTALSLTMPKEHQFLNLFLILERSLCI